MSRLNRGMFSTVRLDWKTPKDIYEKLDAEFHFDLDPCPSHPTFDGLLMPWSGENIFVNPPYGHQIGRWTRKGVYELEREHARRIVWLVPVRTDTKWFQDDLLPWASEIRFIRGRLHFDDAKTGAPFPSCIVIAEAQP